jgi:hypothetical protein
VISLAARPGPRRCEPRSGRPWGLDGGTAPHWFARAADRTLVHDVRQPSGSWSGVTPVGSSPANIASNPAVVANANGPLTVTARTTDSELAYAWQNPGAAALAASGAMAAATYRNGSWTALAQLGGQF